MVLKLFLSFVFLGFGFIQSVFADVRDGAGLFSSSTLETVNRKIEDVKNKTGKDLILETVESTNGTNPASYSLDRAKSLRVNGVYVLIAKKEKKIEIQVGNKTRQVFDGSVTNRFKSKITDSFKSGNYDEGLQNAVGYFSETLLAVESNRPAQKANTPPVAAATTPKSSSEGGTSWLGIIFFVLIIFLIFKVVSALLGRGGGGYNPGYGGMGGGGGMGFFGSLMTGIFGAVAGNWLYDKFMGPGSSGLFGSDNSDNSYSGSSSDWGSSDDSYYSDSGSFDSSDSDGGGDW